MGYFRNMTSAICVLSSAAMLSLGCMAADANVADPVDDQADIGADTEATAETNSELTDETAPADENTGEAKDQWWGGWGFRRFGWGGWGGWGFRRFGWGGWAGCGGWGWAGCGGCFGGCGVPVFAGCGC